VTPGRPARPSKKSTLTEEKPGEKGGPRGERSSPKKRGSGIAQKKKPYCQGDPVVFPGKGGGGWVAEGTKRGGGEEVHVLTWGGAVRNEAKKRGRNQKPQKVAGRKGDLVTDLEFLQRTIPGRRKSRRGKGKYGGQTPKRPRNRTSERGVLRNRKEAWTQPYKTVRPKKGAGIQGDPGGKKKKVTCPRGPINKKSQQGKENVPLRQNRLRNLRLGEKGHSRSQPRGRGGKKKNRTHPGKEKTPDRGQQHSDPSTIRRGVSFLTDIKKTYRSKAPLEEKKGRGSTGRSRSKYLPRKKLNFLGEKRKEGGSYYCTGGLTKKKARPGKRKKPGGEKTKPGSKFFWGSTHENGFKWTSRAHKFYYGKNLTERKKEYNAVFPEGKLRAERAM